MAAHKLEERAGRQVAACLTCDLDRDPDVVERDLNRRGGTLRDEFIPSGGADHDQVAGHQVLLAVGLNRLRPAAHLNAERDHRVQPPRWAVPNDAHAWALGEEHLHAAEHPGFNACRVDGMLTQEIDLSWHACVRVGIAHCVTPCLRINVSCIQQQSHGLERPSRQRP